MARDIDDDSGRPLIKVNHPAPGERFHQMLCRKHDVLFESLRRCARAITRAESVPAALLAFVGIL